MPPVRNPRPARPGRAGNVPLGGVQPDEITAIQRSIGAKEQAPSSRSQAGQFVNWNRLADQLGQPFEIERIPVSRLRSMRKDHMLAFGLAFIKTPIIRANWSINARDSNGVNAQVAANVDEWLRRIYPSFVHQYCVSLDFGFSAIAKRYEERQPAGTFLQTDPDTGEVTEQPLWSEGNVRPITWKPFVNMPPEYVEPIWNGQGEFDGISYKPPRIPGQDTTEIKIDVFHALWATNEKEQNFGSIFGFPRTGYAYRPWWSYWFRWAILDRAFEQRADPATIVRHPTDPIEDPDNPGVVLDPAEYALEMGERLRSGATVSLPSDVYLGEIDGKPSTVRKWDIEFLKEGLNFEPFKETFADLDIAKLRALWIPEQTFLEGRGGTSSRNVAAEMGSHFVEQQDILAKAIAETLNRWVIPQLVATNFPEFVANSGVAEIVIKGFADQDIDFTKQVIQLIGQDPTGVSELVKLIDLEKVLADAGTPLRTFAAQQRVKTEQQQAAALAGQAGPTAGQPAIPGAAGQPGIVPTATGFSYIQPRERIDRMIFSDTGADFVADLDTDAVQYADRDVRQQGRQLWLAWRARYRDEYSGFADWLAAQEQLEFADDTPLERAQKLIRRWRTEGLIPSVTDKTRGVFERIVRRASLVEGKKLKWKSKPTDEQVNTWVDRRVDELLNEAEGSMADEMARWIAKRIDLGVESTQQLADDFREHFDGHPGWKADRLARTEMVSAYNAGTLLAAEANGATQVQAIDGRGGDTDDECRERDGKLFSIDEAWQEREHPNGTLAWQPLPVELTVRKFTPGDGTERAMWMDPETNEVWLSDQHEHLHTFWLKSLVVDLVDKA